MAAEWHRSDSGALWRRGLPAEQARCRWGGCRAAWSRALGFVRDWRTACGESHLRDTLPAGPRHRDKPSAWGLARRPAVAKGTWAAVSIRVGRTSWRR